METRLTSHSGVEGVITSSMAAPAPDRVLIVSTPGIRGGRARIDGHRVTVADVAVWHEGQGMNPDEILDA